MISLKTRVVVLPGLATFTAGPDSLAQDCLAQRQNYYSVLSPLLKISHYTITAVEFGKVSLYVAILLKSDKPETVHEEFIVVTLFNVVFPETFKVEINVAGTCEIIIIYFLEK
jgi:hypothetical protein